MGKALFFVLALISLILLSIPPLFFSGCGEYHPPADANPSGDAANRTYTVTNRFSFPITIYEYAYSACKLGNQYAPELGSDKPITIIVPAGHTFKFVVPGHYGRVVCIDPFNQPTCGTFELRGYKNFNDGIDQIDLNKTRLCPK